MFVDRRTYHISGQVHHSDHTNSFLCLQIKFMFTNQIVSPMIIKWKRFWYEIAPNLVNKARLIGLEFDGL